jgi:DNA-binding IclR family transcriptional regulator
METPKGLRLVEKAVELVDHLAEHGELTIAQLAELTGEPRSSLYRLVGSLEHLGLVEPASSRGYFRMGTHLIEWGAATQAGLNIRDRALPVMERIRSETGLTVYLLVRRGWRGVCVERLEGLRVAALDLVLGGSLPLNVGAAPRALLAFEPEAFWRDYLEHSSLTALTPKTPTTSAELYRVLADERKNGYTISDGDVTPGIAALGAPILDHSGAVAAALSVSGLREEVVGADADRVRLLVLEGGIEISTAMGYKAT